MYTLIFKDIYTDASIIADGATASIYSAIDNSLVDTPTVNKGRIKTSAINVGNNYNVSFSASGPLYHFRVEYGGEFNIVVAVYNPLPAVTSGGGGGGGGSTLPILTTANFREPNIGLNQILHVSDASEFLPGSVLAVDDGTDTVVVQIDSISGNVLSVHGVDTNAGNSASVGSVMSPGAKVTFGSVPLGQTATQITGIVNQRVGVSVTNSVASIVPGAISSYIGANPSTGYQYYDLISILDDPASRTAITLVNGQNTLTGGTLIAGLFSNTLCTYNPSTGLLTVPVNSLIPALTNFDFWIVELEAQIFISPGTLNNKNELLLNPASDTAYLSPSVYAPSGNFNVSTTSAVTQPGLLANDVMFIAKAGAYIPNKTTQTVSFYLTYNEDNIAGAYFRGISNIIVKVIPHAYQSGITP